MHSQSKVGVRVISGGKLQEREQDIHDGDLLRGFQFYPVFLLQKTNASILVKDIEK